MIAFHREREDTGTGEAGPVLAPAPEETDVWTYPFTETPEGVAVPTAVATHPPIPPYHRLG